MALATLKDVLGKAMQADYGVPSFNVHNLEFVQGVMRAALHRVSRRRFAGQCDHDGKQVRAASTARSMSR